MADTGPACGSALAVLAALMTSAPALGVSPNRQVRWVSLCSEHGAVRQLPLEDGDDRSNGQRGQACHVACLQKRSHARNVRGGC